MRILVLASEQFIPARTGTRLRILQLARQLARAAAVDVAAPADEPPTGEPFGFRAVPGPRPRLAALARGIRRPYLAARLESDPLAEIAAERAWDTVQATLPFTVAAARRAAVPVVLDSHNVEAHVLRAVADTERRPVHRVRWRWEASKLERYERDAVLAADAVCAPSERDADVFARWGARDVVVVPNGVDTTAIEHRRPTGSQRLLYVGHYGYLPNVRAARELADEILPRVQRELPEAELRIVGREPPALAGRGVSVVGEVDDVVAEYRAAGALVVPLRVGGGTRLKVLEAMAAGVPVVATRVGVAGLDVADGAHFLLGESASELAAQALHVLVDAELAARLSSAARRLVEQRYDWSVVARPLIELHARLARH